MSSKNILNTVTIFLISALITLNLFFLVKGIAQQLTGPEQIMLEPGFAYLEIRDRLKGIEKIGFLTNKNMTSEGNDGDFLMAQYMLAPTALDLNNPDHELSVLVYTDLMYLQYALKDLNASPVYWNKYGIVLAQKNQP